MAMSVRLICYFDGCRSEVLLKPAFHLVSHNTTNKSPSPFPRYRPGPIMSENLNTSYIESVPWISVFLWINFLSPTENLILLIFNPFLESLFFFEKFFPTHHLPYFFQVLLEVRSGWRCYIATSIAGIHPLLLELEWFSTFFISDLISESDDKSMNRIVFMCLNDALVKVKQVHEHLFVQFRSFDARIVQFFSSITKIMQWSE